MKTKKKSIIAVVLMLVLIIGIIPVGTLKADDGYVLKGSNKEYVLYTKDQGVVQSISVNLWKDGKIVDLEKNKKIKVKWKSSNNKVVKVVNPVVEYDPYMIHNQMICAELRPIKAGKATITASYKNASCKFKVTVKGATMLIDGCAIPAGTEISLDVAGDGWGDLHDAIKYESSNQAVGKVIKKTEYGYTENVLKGIKEGKVTVTAKSELGTIKGKIEILPELNIKTNKGKVIKKNGKLSGYEYKVTNKSDKSVKIVNGAMGWTGSDSGGYSVFKLKEGTVTIKSGQTKTITLLTSESGFDPGVGLSFKYCGHKFSMWFTSDGDPEKQSIFCNYFSI